MKLENPIWNYKMPGLIRWSIKDQPVNHVLQMTRDQTVQVQPHSHCMDLNIKILDGFMLNYLWVPDESGYSYKKIVKLYDKTYNSSEPSSKYIRTNYPYWAGQTFNIQYFELHSWYLSPDSRILVRPGSMQSDMRYLLAPEVDGKALKITNQVEVYKQ